MNFLRNCFLVLLNTGHQLQGHFQTNDISDSNPMVYSKVILYPAFLPNRDLKAAYIIPLSSILTS